MLYLPRLQPFPLPNTLNCRILALSFWMLLWVLLISVCFLMFVYLFIVAYSRNSIFWSQTCRARSQRVYCFVIWPDLCRPLYESNNRPQPIKLSYELIQLLSACSSVLVRHLNMLAFELSKVVGNARGSLAHALLSEAPRIVPSDLCLCQ